MPRYIFKLKGNGRTLEDCGVDLPNAEAAFDYACDVVRELTHCRKLSSEYWRLDVYENGDRQIFRIPLLFARAAVVSDSTTAPVKSSHEQQPRLEDLVRSVRNTMRETRAIVARARGKPYLAAEFGEETIRAVSPPASTGIGLAVSSCFSRGQMVPAEIIRTDTARPVILFVEDEVIIRLDVADFLRAAGYTVLEAGTAHEALTVLKTRPDVALVLTDLRMPGAIDGSGLIRRIRKSYPTVKVVLVSAVRSSEPADAIVAKPYSIERLLEVIKSVLAS